MANCCACCACCCAACCTAVRWIDANVGIPGGKDMGCAAAAVDVAVAGWGNMDWYMAKLSGGGGACWGAARTCWGWAGAVGAAGADGAAAGEVSVCAC